jgi:hypothetical protein
MMRRRWGLVGVALIAGFAAQIAQADEPTPSPGDPSAQTLTPEQLSLQGFGLQSANCVEWGDACSICQRDGAGVMSCSTPGIACQPGAIVCRREKNK